MLLKGWYVDRQARALCGWRFWVVQDFRNIKIYAVLVQTNCLHEGKETACCTIKKSDAIKYKIVR